jgi:predicted DNA-binding transcriptional regulator YafY
MPVNKEAFIRYRIIDQCIRNKRKPFPNIFDIMRACEEKLGKKFSERTLQMDLKTMKEDEALGYLAPIKFSKIEKGYLYTDPNYSIASVPLNDNDVQAIEFAASVLQQYKNVGLFEQFDDAVDKIFNAISIRNIFQENDPRQVIQLEKATYVKGSELIPELLSAVKEMSVISFSYTKFSSEEAKQHKVHPYLLKEYRNRWYLIGMLDKNDRITTFGLDRISDLQLCTDKFRFNHDFDPDIYFKHAYGITTFSGQPEEVQLSFTPRVGQYVLTQPLHETQQLIKETESDICISMQVGITIELINDILSYGADIKVLKPESLASQLKSILEKAGGQY